MFPIEKDTMVLITDFTDRREHTIGLPTACPSFPAAHRRPFHSPPPPPLPFARAPPLRAVDEEAAAKDKMVDILQTL